MHSLPLYTTLSWTGTREAVHLNILLLLSSLISYWKKSWLVNKALMPLNLCGFLHVTLQLVCSSSKADHYTMKTSCDRLLKAKDYNRLETFLDKYKLIGESHYMAPDQEDQQCKPFYKL